jgi:acyl-CoA reductase-like NAD-dependent aldehyde dehydrogenase
MSTSSTTKAPVVLRAQDRQSLVREADFPPGQHFVDGTFRPGSSGRSLDVVDPSSGRTIAQVAEGTAEDTDTAVAAALAAAPGWGRLTPKELSELLHRVADRLAGHADLLARLESANTGKPSAVASVADHFIALLVDEVSTLLIGEPAAGEGVEIGPLVSQAHFDRVTGYLERATAQGIRAAIGGGALDGEGYFVAPTVLVDVPDGAECSREEIFGPVVTVETFTDEDEALTRANDTPFGLAASVWTADARRSHDVASKLDFGTVWVNAHLVLASEVPWGGFKGSGYGRDLSIYALDDYSRTKHVMHSVAR